MTVRRIGTVRSSATEKVDENWGAVESLIELLPEYRAGLRGLEAFSHVLVVAFLHGAALRARRGTWCAGRAARPTCPSSASSRSARRTGRTRSASPSCRSSRSSPTGLRVRGLDAIDGTPILDLKPYFPEFDSAPGARVPEWVGRLMTRLLLSSNASQGAAATTASCARGLRQRVEARPELVDPGHRVVARARAPESPRRASARAGTCASPRAGRAAFGARAQGSRRRG